MFVALLCMPKAELAAPVADDCVPHATAPVAVAVPDPELPSQTNCARAGPGARDSTATAEATARAYPEVKLHVANSSLARLRQIAPVITMFPIPGASYSGASEWQLQKFGRI
ncbi:hypothetical protein [Rhodopseudomonas telluris]|uniref:Uncharacterized protein n=1 Tax=Rhodopseudomonas telluris TaxID=644215 RepID=A0ABV6F0V2_9BRAD